MLEGLNLNSEIETADFADFTDFEEVIGDERTNLLVAKLQGIYNPNLCNLRLNPFSVFGFKVQTEMVRLHRTALVSCASLILTSMGFNPGNPQNNTEPSCKGRQI